MVVQYQDSDQWSIVVRKPTYISSPIGRVDYLLVHTSPAATPFRASRAEADNIPERRPISFCGTNPVLDSFHRKSRKS